MIQDIVDKPTLEEQFSKQPLGQWIYTSSSFVDEGYFGMYEGLDSLAFGLQLVCHFEKRAYGLWIPEFELIEPMRIIPLNLELTKNWNFYFDIDGVEKGMNNDGNDSLYLVKRFIHEHNFNEVNLVFTKHSVIESLIDGAVYDKEFSVWKLTDDYATAMGDIALETDKRVGLKNRKILGTQTAHEGNKFVGSEYHSPYGQKLGEWLRNAPGGTEVMIAARKQEIFDYEIHPEYWSEAYLAVYFGMEMANENLNN